MESTKSIVPETNAVSLAHDPQTDATYLRNLALILESKTPVVSNRLKSIATVLDGRAEVSETEFNAIRALDTVITKLQLAAVDNGLVSAKELLNIFQIGE